VPAPDPSVAYRIPTATPAPTRPTARARSSVFIRSRLARARFLPRSAHARPAHVARRSTRGDDDHRRNHAHPHTTVSSRRDQERVANVIHPHLLACHRYLHLIRAVCPPKTGERNTPLPSRQDGRRGPSLRGRTQAPAGHP